MKNFVFVGIFLAGGLFGGWTCSCWADEGKIFAPASQDQLWCNDATVELAAGGKGLVVHASGEKYAWPGVMETGTWDLRSFQKLSVDVENLSDVSVQFQIRIDDEKVVQTGKNWFRRTWTLGPKEKKTLEIPIPPQFPSALQGKIVGMNGLPGGIRRDQPTFDWGNVRRFHAFLFELKAPASFVLGEIIPQGEARAVLNWQKKTAEEFFPFIDVYGQFRYEDWPGKIHSDADFPERIAQEKADWERHPRPTEWNAYGGWKNGPRQKATGRFYVQKVNGKWWFVDPEGCLFWSHGVDCVSTTNGTTPISLREHYFADLPEKDSPFGRCYGTGTSALHFYQDKGTFQTYNFTQSNLIRKYGADFPQIHGEVVHQRLSSWGMNTIANWSDPVIYGLRKTPYVVTIGYWGQTIAGSAGYWGKFPDPFDPTFREGMRKAIAAKKEFLGTPWCLGVFVNNEMSWGADRSLAQAALASPSTQPAKIAFVKFLQEKYNSIERLNAAWKTTYASWDALLETTDVPQQETLNPDLETFYTAIAEEYFRIVHEELRLADPQVLDLGCRFAWTNARAQRAMAKYVDVMSFNLYRESIADFHPAVDEDKPCIIGEFHFGALDRGMFHTGLCATQDQNDRAEKYACYVTGGLKNPQIVGTHWFQYGSQATTGRFDGENYQIGLVDLGDTPYPEIITKIRALGGRMYPFRYGSF